MCTRGLNIRGARTRRGLRTSGASPPWKGDARVRVCVRARGYATILDLLDSGDHVIASDDQIWRDVSPV